MRTVQVTSTARLAGWQCREQNRVCCPGHDQTNYVRRTRRREAAETRGLAADAIRSRDEFAVLAEGYAGDLAD